MRRRAPVPLALLLGSVFVAGCGAPGADGGTTGADSSGAVVADVREVPTRLSRDLVEASTATMSVQRPGILFTINDSGNEPALFAVDTAGSMRGAWRIVGGVGLSDVQNVDWEAAAVAPCGLGTANPNAWCVFIADIGDNDAARAERSIYRVPEPAIEERFEDAGPGARPALIADVIRFRFPNGPHDAESMYVAPTGEIILITKRPIRGRKRQLRPALVYALAADAFAHAHDSLLVARLVDSLPIVPGTALFRQVTDAGLSADRRHLAVRTYGQVYTFLVDSASGLPRHDVAPARCDVAPLVEDVGEGVAWMPDGARLLFMSEGRRAPLFIGRCPFP